MSTKIQYPHIDWARIAKDCPKAYHKFIVDNNWEKWDSSHFNSKPYEITMWLETVGIYLSLNVVYLMAAGGPEVYQYQILGHIQFKDNGDFTRPETLAAGILKSFELAERKLNKWP